MKKLLVFCILAFILGIIALWLFYLDYMLFPPKPALPIKQEATVEKQEPDSVSTPAAKRYRKKNAIISRLAHPTPNSHKHKKAVKLETASGYPWEKLHDPDVLLALVVVGLLAFAAGVAYFQLYWKKRLPPPV